MAAQRMPRSTTVHSWLFRSLWLSAFAARPGLSATERSLAAFNRTRHIRPASITHYLLVAPVAAKLTSPRVYTMLCARSPRAIRRAYMHDTAHTRGLPAMTGRIARSHRSEDRGVP